MIETKFKTYKTKWLKFEKLNYINRKTEVWRVQSIREIQLGYIKWFTRWRCYAFFPLPSTIFNSDCLKDIKEFIDKLMEMRKGQKK